MKQRLYIDTSVFGGFYDEEFAEFTKPLFERLQKGEFTLLFSKVTQEELALAPDNVKKLVENIKIENTEFIEANEETIELATQ
jgi:predicted nucleic acid-binding protein